MVYLVRGLPGSGKSTYCRDFLGGILHVEADMYFSRNGEYQFKSAEIKDAHDWCWAVFAYAVQYGVDVVVANTFIKRSHLARYVRFCEKRNVEYKVIRCEGGYGSVHDVPDDVIEAMRNGFEDYAGEEIV